MQPDIQELRISAEAEAIQALGQMQRTWSSRLLVTDGDRLLGIVSSRTCCASWI